MRMGLMQNKILRMENKRRNMGPLQRSIGDKIGTLLWQALFLGNIYDGKRNSKVTSRPPGQIS